MKIILTTTLVALLAIGLLGISNIGSNINNAFAQGDGMMGNNTGMMNATLAYAQENDTMSMENDTSMMMNATLPTTIISNATLAYAQEDEMMEMDEDMMLMPSNQSKEEMSLNGTIDVHVTMAEAFKSKVTTDIIGAIQAAQANVGANSFVKEAELTAAHGFLVYKIKVVDENMKKYKVIVDPGNGQVLMKKEITWYDEHKMKYGEEKEKYGKYGHDEQYDKKKMMMMKDKKY
jgi:uncharacterized membrane protein YkoI